MFPGYYQKQKKTDHGFPGAQIRKKKPLPEGNGMGDRIRYFQSRGYSATAYSSLRPLFVSTVRTESILEPVV